MSMKRRELHRKQVPEIAENWKSELVEEEELYVKKWDTDENKEEQELCEEEFPPLVGSCNPPLGGRRRGIRPELDERLTRPQKNDQRGSNVVSPKRQEYRRE